MDVPKYVSVNDKWLKGYYKITLNKDNDHFLLHNEDGPAIIRQNGSVEYYIYGERLEKEAWEARKKRRDMLTINDHGIDLTF